MALRRGGNPPVHPPRHPHPSPLPSRERGWLWRGIGCGVPLTLALSHVGERGFLHRPASLGIPCGRIAARRGHIYLHFWVVY